MDDGVVVGGYGKSKQRGVRQRKRVLRFFV
jgi:hypothetical protein